MQLIQVKGSPYAARVRLLLYRKDAPVELVFPPKEGLKSSDFLAINPIGKIPVLKLDDGSHLPESNVILEYLDDKFPEPPLRPATPEGRARMRLLMQIGDLYVFAAISKLFRQMNPEKRDAEAVEQGFADLAKALANLEHNLGDKRFAVGDAYSLADCSLVPVLFFVAVMEKSFERKGSFGNGKLAAYWAEIRHDDVTARVIAELEDGVRRLLMR